MTETSSPVNTAETSVKYTGRVKWFNNKAGYGFITVQTDTNDVNDIFVHHSGIQTPTEQFKYLVQGEYVEFNTTNTEDRVIAVNVRGPGDGKLMCETRAEVRASRPRPPRRLPTNGNLHSQEDGFRRRVPREVRVPVSEDVEYVVVERRGGSTSGRGRATGRGRARGRGTTTRGRGRQ